MLVWLNWATSEGQVTFIIQSLPSYTPPEAFIYIAGNFNGWNPGDVNYRLSKNAEEMWFITLGQGNQGSSIQYKFTLGNWETVEKGPNGEEIDNRNFVYGNGDTVDIFIANWRQDGGGTSTAAENVSILSEDFEMPQLGRTRRIWLYLPPDYDTSVKSYPVLYMHDGQNLFDAATSFAGEWEVDETLNGFFGQGYQVPIVVGIDHGDEYRIPEYTPWPHPSYGGGEGVHHRNVKTLYRPELPDFVRKGIYRCHGEFARRTYITLCCTEIPGGVRTGRDLQSFLLVVGPGMAIRCGL